MIFHTTRFSKLSNVPAHELRTLKLPHVLFHLFSENMSLLGASWNRDEQLDVNESANRPFPLLVMTFEDRSPEALAREVKKEPWHPPPGNTTNNVLDEQDSDAKEDDDDHSLDVPIVYFDRNRSRMHSLGHITLPSSSEVDERVWILRGGVRVI